MRLEGVGGACKAAAERPVYMLGGPGEPVVMVMEVAKVDGQGRILIPKLLREKAGLVGEAELVEVEEGILLRPKKPRSWEQILEKKVKVDWKQALAVSLEGLSIDDVLFR